MKKITQPFFVLLVTIALASCSSNNTTNKKEGHVDTIQQSIICDTSVFQSPEIKNYKKALAVWLEDNDLNWFLEHRQSAWRDAKAWHQQTFSIDSNTVIKCLCNNKKNVFLYIPNDYYKKTKNGNEFFQFYIVNNSTDTLTLPRLDATMDNIGSAVLYKLKAGSSEQWLSFQQTTKFVDCGNSRWKMKLSPKMAILSEIESNYLNMGDTTVKYRLELILDKQKIISNEIEINLMKKQLPYMGIDFDR